MTIKILTVSQSADTIRVEFEITLNDGKKRELVQTFGGEVSLENVKEYFKNILNGIKSRTDNFAEIKAVEGRTFTHEVLL